MDKLAAGLGDVEHVLVLKGGMGKKELKAVAGKLASIPEGTPRVILATGSYIGEGFDDSRLDALFLTMPISWRGTLQQYVGRLHRIHHGKEVVRVPAPDGVIDNPVESVWRNTPAFRTPVVFI